MLRGTPGLPQPPQPHHGAPFGSAAVEPSRFLGGDLAAAQKPQAFGGFLAAGQAPPQPSQSLFGGTAAAVSLVKPGTFQPAAALPATQQVPTELLSRALAPAPAPAPCVSLPVVVVSVLSESLHRVRHTGTGSNPAEQRRRNAHFLSATKAKRKDSFLLF